MMAKRGRMQSLLQADLTLSASLFSTQLEEPSLPEAAMVTMAPTGIITVGFLVRRK